MLYNNPVLLKLNDLIKEAVRQAEARLAFRPVLFVPCRVHCTAVPQVPPQDDKDPDPSEQPGDGPHGDARPRHQPRPGPGRGLGLPARHRPVRAAGEL